MSVAYRMPVRTELAAKVGPRMFRKTILRAGHISKNGHEVDVDRPYLEALVNNFTSGAMDAVPFQLADGLNRHNADPERTRGRLAGLELTSDDELVGIFETTEEGTKLLDTAPYLGASVSIDPHFKRADGRDFGPTLLHVAGTVDPEVSKLGEWVALSAEYQVIDLTAPPEAPMQQETPDPANPGGDTKEGAAPVASLTDEQTNALLKLLESGGNTSAAETKTDDTKPDAGDSEESFTDAELDAMAEPVKPVDESIAASADRDEALDLANARIDAQQVELSRLRTERDDERFKAEKDELTRTFGIPADVVDLARPLLHGTGHTLDLSAGQVDAGQVLRKVLHELGRRYAKALDLGTEYGTADAEGDAERRKRENEEFIARYRSEMNLG